MDKNTYLLITRGSHFDETFEIGRLLCSNTSRSLDELKAEFRAAYKLPPQTEWPQFDNTAQYNAYLDRVKALCDEFEVQDINELFADWLQDVYDFETVNYNTAQLD